MFLLEAPREAALAALAAGSPVRMGNSRKMVVVMRLGFPGGPSAGYIAKEMRSGKVLRESAPSPDPEVALDLGVYYFGS